MKHLQGAIIFGHGSRDPLWYLPMQQVAENLQKQHPDWIVSLAFLEMNPLSLEQACQNLAQQGVTQLSITPMFVGVGKHVREDLPVLVEALKTQHPKISITLLPAIGEHPDFANWVAQLISTYSGHDVFSSNANSSASSTASSNPSSTSTSALS